MKVLNATRDVIASFKRFAFNFEIHDNNMYIRKKHHRADETLRLLGYSSTQIRAFSVVELEQIKRLKNKIESKFLSRASVIISTCNNSNDKRLKKIKFT